MSVLAGWPAERLVDGVIVLTLIEAALLAAWAWQRPGHALAPRQWALNLASGLCLMLALRAALAGAAWPVWALCLAAAGIAHAADLLARWRRLRPS